MKKSKFNSEQKIISRVKFSKKQISKMEQKFLKGGSPSQNSVPDFIVEDDGEI